MLKIGDRVIVTNPYSKLKGLKLTVTLIKTSLDPRRFVLSDEEGLVAGVFASMELTKVKELASTCTHNWNPHPRMFSFEICKNCNLVKRKDGR